MLESRCSSLRFLFRCKVAALVAQPPLPRQSMSPHSAVHCGGDVCEQVSPAVTGPALTAPSQGAGVSVGLLLSPASPYINTKPRPTSNPDPASAVPYIKEPFHRSSSSFPSSIIPDFLDDIDLSIHRQHTRSPSSIQQRSLNSTTNHQQTASKPQIWV